MGMDLRKVLGIAAIALVSAGCSQNDVAKAPQPETAGTLLITANGEDFVRQGFISKDGWQIDFNNVYVTLSDITAYQAEPAFDPEKQAQPNAKQTVNISEPITVDLAAGGEDAEPIVVTTVEGAPGGRYNALSWRVSTPIEGPADYPLVLAGVAEKDGETIDFQLQLTEELAFVCGDFIGDVRKGILSDGETAEMEATFHFDHLFGDGDAPAEDEINTGALGFDPIAKLAEAGQVLLTSDDLKQGLNKQEYETLQTLLPSLGHVGEGHCEETLLN